MFWGLKLRQEIEKRFSREIAEKKPIIIRDEKTMSGRVHIGSLRGVVIHGLLSELLTDAGIANKYLFEINDFDPMDGLPVYLDQDRFAPYMGRLLCDVPSPDETATNYAEFWAQDFKEIIERAGFIPEYYRSSELYRAGKYNDAIRTALDNAAAIRAIYLEVSGSKKDDDWFPIQIVCEQCHKVGTTKAFAWDGEKVSYTCLPKHVIWAKGCGYEGSVAPFDGAAKLPWKVEWAAKFVVVGVHVEGGGKDHYTKGGSRDIARRILKEVFNYPEPMDVPYNFFVLGGKKMSSSKGRGSSARHISDLLPPQLLRFLMMKEPKREIDFDPEGDTIPILYDHFDESAQQYFDKVDGDWSAMFPYCYTPNDRKLLKRHFMPRFSQVAYLVQMPHIDLADKVQSMKGSPLTAEDKAESDERAEYARQWLQLYSPEKYRFELQEAIPEATSSLSDEQRNALGKIHAYMTDHPSATGEELHTAIHDIKKELHIEPAKLFSAIYLSFLGKDSGPQAGWFLTALRREFVLQRLEEVSQR